MGHLEINAASSVCRKCGKAHSRLKGFFPTSYGFLYKGIGYLPYCKDCVDSMYESYLAVCDDPKKSVRQMCRKLDLYWSDIIFDYVERKNTSRTMMTAYITRSNNAQYAGKCYDDTLIEEGTLWDDPEYRPVVVQQMSREEIQGDADVDPYIVDFWGADFAPDFLIKLDKRYKEWTENEDDLNPGSISLFKHICILEETIARDAAAGRSVDKNLNTLNTLLGSLNLKPVQKKDDATSGAVDNSPMGVWIRRFENERPIPEPDPELRDVDKIVHYIQVFFLGHLAKMLGKTTVYSKMYDSEIARLRVESPELSSEYEDDEDFFESRFAIDEDGDE